MARSRIAAASLLAIGVGIMTPVEADVEREAEDIIRQASEWLAAHERVRFTLRDTIDVLDENGQKIQYEHHRTVEVERPNQIRVKATGDLRNTEAWYDGATTFILLPDRKVWGSIEIESDIDGMLEHAEEILGVHLPAADMASNDLAARILNNADDGRYVGRHATGGHDCHHLAFSNEGVDFQFWIRTDGTMLPQKLVIDYKSLPGEPQYRLEVISVDFPQSYPTEHFRFSPPASAEQVDLVPIVAGRERSND